MSRNKVSSKGQVPFAWERKPGIRKEDTLQDDEDKRGGKIKLPPPPFLQPETGRAISVDLQNIPLPPCAFQVPVMTRSGSKRDIYKEEDDPFLVAYKKCTNSSGTSRRLHKKKNSTYILSCKKSCSVRDDSIVRISQLPISKSTKENNGSFWKFDD